MGGEVLVKVWNFFFFKYFFEKEFLLTGKLLDPRLIVCAQQLALNRLHYSFKASAGSFTET